MFFCGRGSSLRRRRFSIKRTVYHRKGRTRPSGLATSPGRGAGKIASSNAWRLRRRFPSEVIEFDVVDPRTVSREPE